MRTLEFLECILIFIIITSSNYDKDKIVNWVKASKNCRWNDRLELGSELGSKVESEVGEEIGPEFWLKYRFEVWGQSSEVRYKIKLLVGDRRYVVVGWDSRQMIRSEVISQLCQKDLGR